MTRPPTPERSQVCTQMKSVHMGMCLSTTEPQRSGVECRTCWFLPSRLCCRVRLSSGNRGRRPQSFFCLCCRAEGSAGSKLHRLLHTNIHSSLHCNPERHLSSHTAEQRGILVAVLCTLLHLQEFSGLFVHTVHFAPGGQAEPPAYWKIWRIG